MAETPLEGLLLVHYQIRSHQARGFLCPPWRTGSQSRVRLHPEAYRQGRQGIKSGVTYAKTSPLD